MKIVIIGPGALGCLMAASLAASTDHEIWLLDRDPDRAQRFAANGILLSEGNRQRRFMINAAVDPELIGPAGLVLLCVKSHQVMKAALASPPLFGENSLLISFQNGITHLPILEQSLTEHYWAAGVTAMGATLISPGHVRFGGMGTTKIGFYHQKPGRATAVLENAGDLLSSAGIKTDCVDDIENHIWAKFIVNIGINALTAIHGIANGEILLSEHRKNTLIAAVTEASLVAKAKGITLPPDPVALTLEVCQATATNHSSMLQDVSNRRKTEIEAINGALVVEAQRLKIPTPVNEKLFQEVKRREQAYLS